VKNIRRIRFLRAIGAGAFIRNPNLLEMVKKHFTLLALYTDVIR
jgi:hypothetical protein